MTVLIHKKGERDDPSNWRPISLCSTIYKLYASCLAARITDWSMCGCPISSAQKGFMSCEGCYEHNFLLQTAIQEARRQCTVAWLDLINAFRSIPHHHIFATLGEFGMPETFIQILRDLYKDCTTTICATDGETDAIPIRCGMKQGCPLSSIIFNLPMELLIRAVSSGLASFNLHGKRISILAYADDLALVADSSESLQGMLDVANRATEWMGLCFNPKSAPPSKSKVVPGLWSGRHGS
ncbi:unnamed protein product [Eretmochelys imbricata]